MLRTLIEQGWRGGRIGFGEARAGEDHGFWPGEAPMLARATPARQAEFAAGRAAARAALRAVGLVPFAIPMGTDRAPIWPTGVIGSITHHEGRCLAIAARRRTWAGLGIDLEATEPLAAELWPEVLTAAERDWLSDRPADLAGVFARMIFSAKEASYKALYPQTGRIVGFDAMDIRPDPGRTRFTATLNQRFGPYFPGTQLDGQLFLSEGAICTLMALPDAAECGRNVAGSRKTETDCLQPNPAFPLEI